MTNSKNVLFYVFGKGSLNELPLLIQNKRTKADDYCIYFVDRFLAESPVLGSLSKMENDLLFFVDTVDEPTTADINRVYSEIVNSRKTHPVVIVGMGGGCTLDTAKAISNLLTNGGRAEDYQGWDLVRVPGIYKIGIPTISGTGAESSRTCVMTNMEKHLKLGMNSEYTIYDQLIMDPGLSKTVERSQYFYSGVDTYIHCIESLGGRYRHAIGDAFSYQALTISREVFGAEDMQDEGSREKLMVASYLGGCAIANSYVGVVHPLSAGLSTVLKTHHCIGNCIVMNVMEEFYPRETTEFHHFLEKQRVTLPTNVTANLTDEDFNDLYEGTIIHEKPLANALGEGFREILTRDRVVEIFKRM